MKALAILSDPEQSVCHNLARGKSAGAFALERGLFPYRGAPSSVDFTIVVAGLPTFSISLLVQLVAVEEHLGDVVLGYMHRTQWYQIPYATTAHLLPEQRWVLVKYSIQKREDGHVYMTRQLSELIFTLRKREQDNEA